LKYGAEESASFLITHSSKGQQSKRKARNNVKFQLLGLLTRVSQAGRQAAMTAPTVRHFIK